MARSLELGEIVPVSADAPPTLCDALRTPRVSPITFGILRDRNARAVSVSDSEVTSASTDSTTATMLSRKARASPPGTWVRE